VIDSQASELLKSVETAVREKFVSELSRRRLLTPDQIVNIASEMGVFCADFLAVTWGGQQVYFPKDARHRADMMYRRWNGNNYAELAREFGVAIHTVYRAIKREQEARRVRQGSLLDSIKE
jgi:hypothetical protein